MSSLDESHCSQVLLAHSACNPRNPCDHARGCTRPPCLQEAASPAALLAQAGVLDRQLKALLRRPEGGPAADQEVFRVRRSLRDTYQHLLQLDLAFATQHEVRARTRAGLPTRRYASACLRQRPRAHIATGGAGAVEERLLQAGARGPPRPLHVPLLLPLACAHSPLHGDS